MTCEILLDFCMYCTVFFASDRVIYSCSCENTEGIAKFSDSDAVWVRLYDLHPQS